MDRVRVQDLKLACNLVQKTSMIDKKYFFFGIIHFYDEKNLSVVYHVLTVWRCNCKSF